MNMNDTAPGIDTDQFMPPRLDFLRRFIYDAWNERLTEVERETTGPLMTPLMMPRERRVRFLSPIAKMMDDETTPATDYENLLPPTDIAAVMIGRHQLQQPNATAPVNQFPFKLKAIGRVNAMQIFNRAGQTGTLVSNTVEVVP